MEDVWKCWQVTTLDVWNFCFLRMQVELFFICKHAQTGIGKLFTVMAAEGKLLPSSSCIRLSLLLLHN